MTSATVWVMAGGTGGHIVPGLAVADELQRQGFDIRWVGNPDKMEGRLVGQAGIKMIPVRFHGVRGKGLLQKMKAPFSLLASTLALIKEMLRQKPGVVLGMGGYVSLPGGVAATLMRVPIVLHEQNAIAGMSNKWLAKVATKVLTGFPGALPGSVWTGNPVRRAMTEIVDPDQRYAQRTGPLNLLVVGGSLGAKALNEIVPQALSMIPDEERPLVVHQAGQSHLDTLQAEYEKNGIDARCLAFIDDMASAMSSADLLICRAGAMTVSEVAAAGVAALFVPYPYAVDDHQTANANYLVRHQAAFIKQQSELTPEWLAGWLRSLQRQELGAMAVRARQFAKCDAAQEIARVCVGCIGGSK